MGANVVMMIHSKLRGFVPDQIEPVIVSTLMPLEFERNESICSELDM